MELKYFYGSNDPRELPLYSIGEAAQHIRVPPSTLRTWVVGRDYMTSSQKRFSPPLVQIADAEGNRLSFNNLIEAYVINALRVHHEVRVQAIRTALHVAEERLGIQRLLIRDELCTADGELFWDEYGRLVNLSRSGQLVIRELFAAYLKRVERDQYALPIRLYPIISEVKKEQSIVIDPQIAFGRPVIAGRGITTRTILQRIEAGESLGELAEDYGIEETEIKDALAFELAA